ncbi:MAG TPA: PIN domain-containing protein [Candidatus Limnocylindrales bacterium]|nr:PIN domain-containing protein [Candidatus Limnocylindrales bacterium]
MSRTFNPPNRSSAPDAPETSPSKAVLFSKADAGGVGSFWDMLAIRLIFTVVCVATGYHFRPFSLSQGFGAIVGLAFAVAVILFEIRLRRASLRRLIGAVIGSILGILGAYLATLVLVHTSMPESTRSFISLAVFLVMAYIGLIVGANKGDMLNLQALGGLFGTERGSRHIYKVLDTSVIIDGRVVDIAEAHFIDGTVIIPQFVLRELQMVADSADPLRRQRGRRGLEVLQRIQKMPHLDVQIAEDDFPNIAEVDLKLIELAKRYDAKIITNDFNLNKVATLQGIEILNVNLLANALKPVVLPGETMRVFILREGKEYNQGVAYLDDGTMVVADGARKMINKTVDITVTSVHQTTAGKMIFGRYDERGEQNPARAVQPAPGSSAEVAFRSSAPEVRSSDPGAPGDRDRPARPLTPETGHT